MPRNRIIPFFIPHVGCSYRCVYCNQAAISGREHAPSPRDVTEAIKQGLSVSDQGAEVAFFGGSFTAVPLSYQEALLAAVTPFIQSGAVCSVRVSTRPDAISQEVLYLLKKNHVKTVELGCQSADDAVLTLCGRGHTRDDIVSATEKLRASGFQVVHQMMTGLPGSDSHIDKESASFLASLRPDGVRIYPTLVVDHTPLAELFRAGLYQPETLQDSVDLCADLMILFSENGIPILRFGLQPSVELQNSVLAGPYHPAFGEMVKSRLLFRQMYHMLQNCCVKEAVFHVPTSLLSAAIGQNRSNLSLLRGIFSNTKITISDHLRGFPDRRIESAESAIPEGRSIRVFEITGVTGF